VSALFLISSLALSALCSRTSPGIRVSSVVEWKGSDLGYVGQA